MTCDKGTLWYIAAVTAEAGPIALPLTSAALAAQAPLRLHTKELVKGAVAAASWAQVYKSWCVGW